MPDPHVVASTCQHLGVCALSSADKAAWASAIGSIGAAVVALSIALSGGVLHWWQRRRDGKALAAYIAVDVKRVHGALENAIFQIERRLKQSPDHWINENLFGFASTTNAELAGAILLGKVDRFGLLPGNMGQELAGAVGSLDACQSAVSRFVEKIGQVEKDDIPIFCRPILSRLRRTKHDIERTRRFCEKVTSFPISLYDRIFHA